MFGDGDAEPSKDHAVLLCWEACKVGLPLVLAHKLNLLDFETRKDAAQASPVLVHRTASRSVTPHVSPYSSSSDARALLYKGPHLASHSMFGM